MRLPLCPLFFAALPLFAYQPGDTFIPVALTLQARDIIYEPVSGKLLAALSAANSGGVANTLGILNAETGAVEASIALGGEPSTLAVSDDGRFAYAGIVGGAFVKRVDLVQRRVDLDIPLGADNFFGNTQAESIAVAPRQATRIAVSRMYSSVSPRHAGVTLFDNATALANSTPGHTGANVIAFDGDPTRLYGLNTETTEFGFRTIAVSSSGLSVLSVRPVNVGFNGRFALEGGRAYFNSGSVWDVARSAEIGRLASGLAAPYASAGIVGVVASTSGSAFSGPYEFRIYDLATLTVRDQFPLPNITSPTRLVRMGTRGFALIAQTGGSGSATITLLALDEALRPVLANASTRGVVGLGDDVMIAGLVVQGNAPRVMLVRVLGPTLASFGVAGTLADPVVELYAGATKLAENDDWRDAGTAALSQLTRLQITPGADRESVILRALAPGAYTAVVRTKAGQSGGVALVEAYDVEAYGGDFSAGTAKAANLSTRSRVGAGGDVLITGFVIGGNLPRRVLLNGIGGSLTAFGVSGALANPRLELYQGSRKITEIDDWIDSTQFDDLVNTGSAPRDLAESALLLTLNPGAYTAIVSGVGGTQGVALAEVYDVRTLQDIRLVRTNVNSSFATLTYAQAGTSQAIALAFLTGNSATLAGGPLGTFSYSTTGRNTASVSITASNASLSGTLRFFRAGVAQFRGTVTRNGQSSGTVTGTLVFE